MLGDDLDLGGGGVHLHHRNEVAADLGGGGRIRNAYSAPTIQATGDLITAAIWNQNVVNNMIAVASASCYRTNFTAATSIPNAANTAITFNNTIFNEGTDISLSSTKLVVATAGKYDVGGHIEWASNSGFTRRTILRLNGATEIAHVADNAGGSSDVIIQSVSTLWQFAANDYVELVVFQDTGGALNVASTSDRSPELWMALRGR